MTDKPAFEALVRRYGRAVFTNRITDIEHAFQDVLAAYDAAAGREGQPVAWRWRRRGAEKWAFTDIPPTEWDKCSPSTLLEWEPVYSAGSQGETEYVIQLLIAGGIVAPEKIEQARSITRSLAASPARVRDDRSSGKIWHDHYYQAFMRWLEDDSTHWINDKDAAWQAWMYLHEEGLTTYPEAAMSRETQ